MNEDHGQYPQSPIPQPKHIVRRGAGGGALAPAHPEGYEEDAAEPNGTPLIPMLLRHRWWMIGVALSVAVLSVPAVWLFVRPQYHATAEIRVSPVMSRIVYKNEDNDRLPFYHAHLHTQVAIIRSPDVLMRVLDLPQIQGTDWYQTRPLALPVIGGPISPLERLREDLTVGPKRNTELIEVRMTTYDAAEAKLIADTVVGQFSRFTEESVGQIDIQRVDTLSNKRDILQKEIAGLIETKFNLSQRLGTLAPDELRTQQAIHLSDLDAEYQRLLRTSELLEWELEARGAQGGDVKDNAQDPEWRTLRGEFDDIENALSLALQQLGDSHPKISELKLQVQHAEQRLQTREQQIQQFGIAASPAAVVGMDDPSHMALSGNLEFYLSRTRQQLALLEAEIETQKQKARETGEIALKIANLDEEITRKREIYETVRARLQELDLESKGPARISIASLAVAPDRPQKDRRPLLSMMLLGLAAMCGVGVAYLRGTLDPTIHAAEDLRQTVRTPFLGQLPTLPETVSLNGSVAAAVTESMRMVRTALLERIHNTDKQVVLVTSSASGSGKTTVAVLLARSLGKLGKRVLLVEGDLRRPTLSKRLLGFDSKIGLAALLSGVADEKEAILSSGVPHVDLVVAGQMPDEFNFELLANGAFSGYLDRWTKSYDLVLLDSPPILPVADAPILARQTDGTIMVLRASHCRRTEVVKSFAELSAAGAALLGTVLVGAPASLGYGKTYGATTGAQSKSG